MVAAGEAPESGELRDVLEDLNNPNAITLARLIDRAEVLHLRGLADELRDRKQRRSIPQKLDRAGYLLVRNLGTEDGYFSVGGRRVAVYARAALCVADQIRADGRQLGLQFGHIRLQCLHAPRQPPLLALAPLVSVARRGRDRRWLGGLCCMMLGSRLRFSMRRGIAYGSMGMWRWGFGLLRWFWGGCGSRMRRRRRLWRW